MKPAFLIISLITFVSTLVCAQENDYEKAVRTYRENKPDSSSYYIEQSLRQYNTGNRMDSVVLALVQKALVVWDQQGLDATFRLMDSTHTLAHKLPEKSVARVASYSRMGQLHLQKREFDKSRLFFNKAEQSIDVSLAPNKHYVLLYNYIAGMLLLENDFSGAFSYVQRAYNMNLPLEGKDGITMVMLLQTRFLINSYSEQYNAALEDAREFQRVALLHYPSRHPVIGTMHNSVAVIYESLRRYEEALYHRQRAVDIQLENYIDSGDGFSLAAAYQNLGNLYVYINEPFLAQEYLHKGTKLLTKTFKEDGPGMVNILVDMAVSKSRTNQYDEAEQLLVKAYELQLQHAPYSIADLAYLEGYRAGIYQDKKEYLSALTWYQRAMRHYEQMNATDTEFALEVKKEIAKVLSAIGRYEAAIKQTNGLISSFRKKYARGNIMIADAIQNVSDVLFVSGKINEALIYSESVFTELLLSERDLNLNSEWISELPFSYKSLVYIYKRVEVLESMYKSTLNEEYLLNILAITDQYNVFISENLHAFRSQAALIELADVNKQLFSIAINACWELSRQGKNKTYTQQAFMYAEMGKALLLKLSSNHLLSEQSIEKDDIFMRDYAFRKKVNEINLQYLNEDRSDELLASLSHTIEQYRLFQDSLKNAGDARLQQKNDLTPASLDAIRTELLKEEQTLLEYVVADSAIFLFVITTTNYQMLRIDRDVLKEVATLRELYNISPEDFVPPAYRLYRHLIQPVEHLFTSDRILIIPDGELHYLNFELLLSDNKEYSFSKMPYLIHRYNISYLLSASSAIQLKAIDEKHTMEKLLLFTPVFSDEMKEAYFSRFENDVLADETYRYLFRQPFALQGALRIGKLMPHDLYAEQAAEERTFKQLAGNYHILHLGTHAEVNNHSPLQSRFFFAKAMPDDTLNTDDGYLYAHEIYSMQLHAELAVLTACETGAGTWRNGEGVISLSHSFMYAGCPSVIMSLWKIDEKTSTEIIEYFYESLSKGDSKSGALRKAKLKIAESSDEMLSHPYYWAGLALVGDDTPVYNSNTYTGVYRIMVFVLLLIIAVIVIQAGSEKKHFR